MLAFSALGNVAGSVLFFHIRRDYIMLNIYVKINMVYKLLAFNEKSVCQNNPYFTLKILSRKKISQTYRNKVE